MRIPRVSAASGKRVDKVKMSFANIVNAFELEDFSLIRCKKWLKERKKTEMKKTKWVVHCKLEKLDSP